MPKPLLTLLLICAVFIPLGSQPVASQIMSAAQTGMPYSVTYSISANTTTIQYEHRPDDYNYQTGAFTLGEYEWISHPRPPPFEQEREHICLYYDYFVFRAEASQKIKLHFETASPVRFYLMSLEQLYSFYRSLCGHEYWSSETKAFASAYSVEWVVPQTGVYVFLFAVDRPYGQYAAISFTAET